MSNPRVTLVPALLVLSLSACANAPLTNEEIDQTCRLLDRCGGSLPSCAATLLAEREDVAATGCDTEWAQTFRCLVAEDSCTVPTDCYAARDQYEGCLLHGPANPPGDWVDRMRQRVARHDRLGCETDCPAAVGAWCRESSTTDDWYVCLRAAGARFPEIVAQAECAEPIVAERAACVLEIIRVSCTNDYSACDHDAEVRFAACPEASAEANDAIRNCSFAP
jgi:hypothetical protein